MATRSLGALTIDLIAKTHGFEQGMDKAAKAADKRLTDIEKSARKIGAGIGTALTAGFGVAAAGFGIYIKNTIEAEKVQAQLASRIKDTFGAAGRSLEDLNKQADLLQSKTIFDDEAIGEAQAMLLTFKDIEGVTFDKTIEASLDLATVMGTDAADAAKILGKALNDPERGLSALTKAGITFTEAEREQIKAMTDAGQVADAQEAILKKLEGTMGSAAEASRNTLGGALQGLQNAFDNLLEGDASGGGVKATTDAINELSETLADPSIKQSMDRIAGGIAGIAAEAIGGISRLEQLAQAHRDLFSIADKVAAGAPASEFTDRELQIRMANIQEQIGKARKSGNNDELKRLLAEREKLVRDSTRRIVEEQGSAAERERRGFSQAYEAAALNVNPNGDTKAGRSGGGGGRGSVHKGPDFTGDAARELDDLVRKTSEAAKGFEAIAAMLDGPLAEANYRYAQDQEHLNELAKEGEISAQDLAKAQENLAKQHAADVEAINAQLNPSLEYIKALQEEVNWLGATEAQQRKLEAARMAGANATAEQREELEKWLTTRDQMREVDENFSRLHDNIASGLYDIASGSKSAIDGIEDFFDSLNAQILSNITDEWADMITDFFKDFAKSSGGAGGGGTWANILSAIGFGGGKATGGWTMPNTMYEVNERGLEMATVRGRDYLLTGSSPVEITPNHRLGGGPGYTQNLNFNLAAPTDPRSQQQIAEAAGRYTRLAMARNG